MSRSYKKTPGWTDSDPWMKNYANRRVRRIPVTKEVGDGSWYRRWTCPWDICDWKFLYYPGKQLHWRFQLWDEEDIQEDLRKARAK